jgi:hypothetical protein
MSYLGNLLITRYQGGKFCCVYNFSTGKAGDFSGTLVTLGSNSIRVLFRWAPCNDG